ncbi:MAG: hypothetical protein RLZZ175_1995 [Bacteroidota bacterium]|jgi:hypothetical protein
MNKIVKNIFWLHLLFWVANISRDYFEDSTNLWMNAGNTLVTGALFYINYFWLVPIVLKKSTPINYLIWFLSFYIIFITFYSSWIYITDYELNNNWPLSKRILISGYLGFYYGAVSTGLRFASHWFENLDKNKTLEWEKTNTQLQLFKSNINIPFMLKALTYAENVSKQNPENVSEPIISLSNILRFGLYESQKQAVPLHNEIEILKEFIQLNNQIENNYTLQLNHEKVNENLQIIPNILVRFVALWLNLNHNNFQKDEQIKLESIDNEIILQLNISSGFNISDLEHQFQHFKDEYFEVIYFTENNILSLKISNL